MTKSDFFIKIPGIITHKSWGHGELEIVSDSNDKKGVCYRHRDNTASCGTYASTWSELYKKLSDHLLSEGYMKSK